jgi:heat shock protein HtpX
MASFFDEVAKNKVKSFLLLMLFSAFFAVIVYLLVLVLGGGYIALGIGIAVIIAYAAFVYFTGDKVVLAMSRAKEADPKEYKNLYDIVDSLATANQVKMPKIYVIEDPNPNAFATGKNRNNASVCVTTGLLKMMNNEELTGVLAHEMSHVFENDIQFMMIAVVFAGAIGIMAIILRNVFWFGGRGRNGGMLVLIGLAAGFLAPLMAMLVRLAISRRREYMADANGARVIRDPQALASALKKIQAYMASPKSVPVQHANEMTASLYFSNPFKFRSAANLFSTHPPIGERIARLEKMY